MEKIISILKPHPQEIRVLLTNGSPCGGEGGSFIHIRSYASDKDIPNLRVPTSKGIA